MNDPYTEAQVIGAILVNPEVLDEIAIELEPKHFSDKVFRWCYERFLQLAKDSEPISFETLFKGSPDLRERWSETVISAMDCNPTAVNVVSLAREVGALATRRKVRRVGEFLTKEASNSQRKIEDIIANAESQLLISAFGEEKTREEPIGETASRTLESLESAIESSGLLGIPSGLIELDSFLSGFIPTDLTVLAGRPGMGKSALAMSIAVGAAKEGNPVVVYSLEMSREQYVLRVLADWADLNAHDLRQGKYGKKTMDKIRKAARRMDTLPLWIDDSASLTMAEICHRARRMKKRNDIKMVVIDYLQIISGGGGKGRREEEVAEMSRQAKQLAKELNVPVILLSQLNRTVELEGGSKRPQIWHLRESGAIEQDADVILFLYRKDYYYKDAEPGLAEVLVRKQRQGPQGTVYLHWRSASASFRNLSHREEPKPQPRELFPKNEVKAEDAPF